MPGKGAFDPSAFENRRARTSSSTVAKERLKSVTQKFHKPSLGFHRPKFTKFSKGDISGPVVE